jgi:hypothetical protein
MLTTIDKAIVAVLGGLLTIAAAWGFDTAPLAPYIEPAGALLTGFLTWLVPNREAN